MPITDFTGKSLLDKATIEQIQKETKNILQKKDVARAWQAATHIKTSLASLPQEQVAGVLEAYRSISTTLKIVALPVLSYEDVYALLKNNYTYITEQTKSACVEGLQAWYASQDTDTQKKAQETFLAVVPETHEVSASLKKIFETSQEVLNDIPVSSASQNTQKPPKTDDGSLDAEESKEVSEHHQKVADMHISSAPVDEAQTVAETLYNAYGKGQDKETYVKRAHALVLSRLKDIRTQLELQSYFTRPSTAGGLGMSPDTVPQALEDVEAAYTRVHTQSTHTPVPQTSISKPQQNVKPGIPKVSPLKTEDSSAAPSPKKVDTTPQPLAQTSQEKKLEADAQNELNSLISQSAGDEPLLEATPSPKQQQKRSIPVTDATPKKIPQPKAVNTQTEKPTVQKKQPDTIQQKQPTRIIRERSTQKPRMDDITQSMHKPLKTKSVGMAGEIGTMDIADLRRSGSPQDAVQSVLEKIQLLEENSLLDKIDGIKQFRMSPVYTQYLAIGEASLGQGKKLSEALADKTINPDAITEDEFFAIASLQSMLK